MNDKKLTVEEIKEKLFKDIFGFSRMRKQVKANIMYTLEYVIHAQKKFDYRYYLAKNCPLPANWKELKV